jgi:hypothetical protein
MLLSVGDGPGKSRARTNSLIGYGSLNEEEQERVDYVVGKLEADGPLLRRPAADTVIGSRFPNMKELRINNPPMRLFCAFDPRRIAI